MNIKASNAQLNDYPAIRSNERNAGYFFWLGDDADLNDEPGDAGELDCRDDRP